MVGKYSRLYVACSSLWSGRASMVAEASCLLLATTNRGQKFCTKNDKNRTPASR